MRRPFCFSRTLLLVAAAALLAAQAVAATITLTPSRDNTLFESATGGLSDGQGDFFFAGQTANDLLRRGLLAFNVSGAVPAGSVITGVTLTLHLSRIAPGAPASAVSLHAVLADWGEGASRATGPEGSGGTAQPGDATWLHRFAATANWAAPGGDFRAQASGTTLVSASGATYAWSGSGLVSDVQGWLDQPASNFGWMVRGNEAALGSAKRFNSRSHPDAGTRPQLTIEYQPVPEPSTAAMLAVALLCALCMRQRGRLALCIGMLAASGASVSAQFDPANPIPTPIPRGPARIDLQPVATGLVSPGLFLSAPGDAARQFIVEQTGQVRVLQNGGLLPAPFLDVASRLVTLNAGYDERGLLGLAFDPGFADPASPGHGRIFTYTSEPAASGTPDFLPPTGSNGSTTLDHHSVVASWRVSATNPDAIDPASRQEVLRFGQPQGNHNGGAIAFGPDGLLYIATGDGGGQRDSNANGHNPAIGNGQDHSTLLGKMLRIDVNGANSANGRYGIPADNPFAAGGGAREIYASGFRNPYRFSFDGVDLWVGDVGQGRIEELDRVELGKNYGWRYKEGSFKFNAADGSISDDLSGLPAGLTDPVLQYDHDEGLSIIGGFVYRGALLPDLAGKYIFGDFSTSVGAPEGRLFYADLQTQEIREFILGGNDQPLGLFVKGIGEDASGELYVLGSTALGPGGTSGVALKIVPEPAAGTLWALGMAALAMRRPRRQR